MRARPWNTRPHPLYHTLPILGPYSIRGCTVFCPHGQQRWKWTPARGWFPQTVSSPKTFSTSVHLALSIGRLRWGVPGNWSSKMHQVSKNSLSTKAGTLSQQGLLRQPILYLSNYEGTRFKYVQLQGCLRCRLSRA